MQPCDVAFTGARVIDPETGLDAVRSVGVTGGRITAVTTDPVPARRTIDATGLVLAPGFIDLHNHAQTRPGLLLSAMDGVTTALDLEMGATSVTAALSRAGDQGRPIHYGFAASWLLTRMRLLDGVPETDPLPMFTAHQNLPRWRAPAPPRDTDRILDELAAQIADGAIGIGVLVGYAPETGQSEYYGLASLAARLDVPTFTHTRYVSTEEPGTSLAGILEVIAAAAGTGAHMHVCHLNSTSNRMIDETAAAVDKARGYGLRLTTEAYPYGSGSTVIGADFLAPDQLHRLGLTPRRLRYLPTGEWLSGPDRLAELRATDPGGPVILQWADERDEADRAILLRSLLLPDTAIASDALTAVLPGGAFAADTWPMPPDALTHPRSGGCYARTFGWLVRDLAVLTLPDAVRRCTLLPAQILAAAVPAMRTKARVQPGMDADLVLFDPATFAEGGADHRATPSTGVRHLLVDGQFVIDDGTLNPDASPGRPVRSGSVAG